MMATSTTLVMDMKLMPIKQETIMFGISTFTIPLKIYSVSVNFLQSNVFYISVSLHVLPVYIKIFM